MIPVLREQSTMKKEFKIVEFKSKYSSEVSTEKQKHRAQTQLSAKGAFCSMVPERGLT